MPEPLIAIVGPTAAGKSDLSLTLARALDGEVINADSMQLYRGMDIGTAKLRPSERGGVPHHLLDIWDVTKAANVAEYQQLARAAIGEIRSRGRIPIIVGGSGLYVRAVIDNLDFPATDPQVRDRLEGGLAQVGAPAPHPTAGVLGADAREYELLGEPRDMGLEGPGPDLDKRSEEGLRRPGERGSCGGPRR